MGASEEVAQVDEFAVAFVLNVDGTPAVLASTDLLAIDCNVLLRADNGKWDDALNLTVSRIAVKVLQWGNHLDLRIHRDFL